MARLALAVLVLCFLGCGKDKILNSQDSENTPAGKLVMTKEKVSGDKNPEFFFTNYAILKITLKDFCSIDCGYEFTNWEDRGQGKEFGSSYYRIEYRHGSRNPWTEGWVSNIPIFHKKGEDEATVLTSTWAMYSKENVSGLYDLRLVWVNEKRVATEVIVWRSVPVNAGRDLLELDLFSDGQRNISYSKTFAEKSLSFYFDGKIGPIFYKQGEVVVIKWSGSWGYGYREGDWISLSLFELVSDEDYTGVFVKDIVLHYPIEKGVYRLSTKDLPVGRYLVRMVGSDYGNMGSVFELKP